MRIGILGGTFNPPHLGHLVCAQEAHIQLELDEVLLIPTHTPPHKQLRDDAGPGHRLELCRLAVGGDERFAVSDLEQAREIVLNAKLQRPGVCNAAETLLVHAEVAEPFLPQTLAALGEAGVVLHGDERARVAAPATMMQAATDEDWDTEYLALELAVRVVDSPEEAIAHINVHGSGHSEAIVTRDTEAARSFQLGVDAACVYVNASTRFTDGGEFGMGAEIGNSTQKLHARGPIGVRELCTFKYLVDGSGQVRA